MLPNPYLLLAGFGPILFGLGLLVALRILGRPDQNPDNPVAFLLLLTSRIAVILGVLVLLGGFGLLLAPVLVIVIGFVVREVRQAQRRMLLELLAVAAERNVPLSGAVEAFAAERSGWPARKARRLCALLGEGRTLSDALDGAWGLLSPEARMHIRLGEELSALAPALREAMGPPAWEELIWRQLSGKVLYLTAVLLFLTVVVTFMFLKIVPAYVKIFADYGAKFPEATQRLYQCLHFVDKCPLLYPLCLAVPGLLGFFTLARALGLVRWNLPGMDRVLRGWYAGTILDALALATRAERPLARTIELLAERYPRRWVRRRLALAGGDIRAGHAWCESLHERGLITRAEAAVLQAASRVDNLSWALREMAAGSRRRLGYRVQAWMQVAFPLAVASIGLLVLLVVVGLYSPLLQLVRTISGWS